MSRAAGIAARGSRVAGLAIALAAACAGRATAPPLQAVHDGISIALYALPETQGSPGRSYGMVDDRRWIDVAGDASTGSFVLDRIAPDVPLESLVIEPLAGGRLELGTCLRERVTLAPGEPAASDADAVPGGVAAPPGHASPRAVAAAGPAVAAAPVLAPMLRCAVRAARGRYLVRVLYVSRALGYRPQHDIAMTAPDRATVASRFAIATPAWHLRATVVVFQGMPGTEHPPRELVRGPVVLDGSTAVLAVPPRTVPAELRRIYDGAVRTAGDAEPRERRWHQESHPAVWVWLELHGTLAADRDDVLAVAPMHAHIKLPGEPARDIDVPAAAHRISATGVRVPLWIDPTLRGQRERTTDSPEDGALTDKLLLSVANTGSVAHDIWLEEELRPTRRRSVVRAWPIEPSIAAHTLRIKLTVPPGKRERSGFEIRYEL